ncbi:hypothetical protein CSKR_106622 [Clonorchis sinensis]|uniref:Ribosome biogenesis protein NOP53 n=1 Tax=Clonorchis sinensis TaxID=79923 RepID=A0A8T1MFU9_CLOSI|nr:hypothetical protein CSKR_106622 [Clonorchis sinensis]
MKNLGKNKKKQWRHCCTGLEDKLDAAKKREAILHDGFVLGQIKRQKKPIIRGDKEAAKLFSDISTAPDGRVRMKHYQSKTRPGTATDLWQDEILQPEQQKRNQPNLSLPAAGQSYNPSVVDHFTLLSTLGAEECKKHKRQQKTERFLRGFTENARRPTDPMEEARTFFHSLTTETPAPNDNDGVGIIQPNETEEVVLRHRSRKRKKVNMAVELENIPKLLKELRRESQACSERKARLAAKKATRKRDQLVDWDIPFQMPNELVSCLRKVVPESDLLRELEKRKNKCPRARRTLGLTKSTKAYERRRVTT